MSRSDRFFFFGVVNFLPSNFNREILLLDCAITFIANLVGNELGLFVGLQFGNAFSKEKVGLFFICWQLFILYRIIRNSIC